jgi:hypothetical protein
MKIAWGAKVSQQFRDSAIGIAQMLGVEVDFLMACMAFESGETFSPSVRNSAGSGAVGLIQFMPQTAAALGTTTEALAAMTNEEQLIYVQRYFQPWAGRLRSLADLYMAILWPAGVGKDGYYVIFDSKDVNHPKLYIQNRGLDWNHDGVITVDEAAAGPMRKLQKGRLPEFLA